MKLPPENTAELSALYLLSVIGIIFPKYFLKISGYFFSPSVESTKITPSFSRCAFMLEYADSESNCASTPARNALSCSGTPSRSKVILTSSGTSSHDLRRFSPLAR